MGQFKLETLLSWMRNHPSDRSVGGLSERAVGVRIHRVIAIQFGLLAAGLSVGGECAEGIGGKSCRAGPTATV